MTSGLINLEGATAASFGGPGIDNVLSLPSGGWLAVTQEGSAVVARYYTVEEWIQQKGLELGDVPNQNDFGQILGRPITVAASASDPAVSISSDGTVFIAYKTGNLAEVVTINNATTTTPTITKLAGVRAADAGTEVRLQGLADDTVALASVTGGTAKIEVMDKNGTTVWSDAGIAGQITGLSRSDDGKTLIAAILNGNTLSAHVYTDETGTVSVTAADIAADAVGSPDVALLNTYPAQGPYGHPQSIVTWQTTGGDVYAQVLNVDGTDYEAPFLVAEDASAPSVIMQPNGELVFSYTAADADGTGVYAVGYSYTGLRTSDPVLVHEPAGVQANSNVTAVPVDQSLETGDSGAQTLSDMVSLRGPNGEMTGETLIAWTIPATTGNASIRLGHYDTDGEAKAIPQTIVPNTPNPSEVNLIQLSDGRALVMWTEADGTSGSALKVQVLTDSYQPVGGVQGIAVGSLTNVSLIDVVADGAGGFDFAFAAKNGADETVIHAGSVSTIGNDGAFTPTVFEVVDKGNTTLSPDEITGQAVVMEGTDRTALVFASDYNTPNRNDVFAVSFDANGRTEGPLLVNDHDNESADNDPGSATNPTVALVGPDMNGRSLYTGSGTADDTTATDIFFRGLLVAWETDENGAQAITTKVGVVDRTDTDGSAIMMRMIGYAAADYARPNYTTTGTVENKYLNNNTQITIERGDFVRGSDAQLNPDDYFQALVDDGKITEAEAAVLINKANIQADNFGELRLPLTNGTFRFYDHSLVNYDLTDGNQTAPQIITLFRTDGSEVPRYHGGANGSRPVDAANSVIAYTTDGGEDGSGTSLHFILLKTTDNVIATPISASIRLNTQSAGDQVKPVLQPVEGGGFRVAFQSVDPATGDARIMAAEFDRFGNTVAADANTFSITYTAGTGDATGAYLQVGQIDGYENGIVTETTEGGQQPNGNTPLLDPETGKPTGEYVAVHRQVVYDENGNQAGMIGRFQIFDANDQPQMVDAEGNPKSVDIFGPDADSGAVRVTALPNGGFAISSGMRLWIYDSEGQQKLYDGMQPGDFISLNASGTDGVESWSELYDQAFGLTEGTTPDEGTLDGGARLRGFEAEDGSSRVFITYSSQGQGGVAGRSALVGRIFDVEEGVYVPLPEAERAMNGDTPLNPDTTLFHIGAGLPETMNDGAEVQSATGFEMSARDFVDLRDGTSLISMNGQYGRPSDAYNFLVRIDNETGEAVGNPELVYSASPWSTYPLSPVAENEDGSYGQVLISAGNTRGLRALLVDIDAPSDENPNGLSISDPIEEHFPGVATGGTNVNQTWGTGLYKPDGSGELSGKFVLLSSNGGERLATGLRDEYTLMGRIFDATGPDGPVPVGDAFDITPTHTNQVHWPDIMPRLDGGFTVMFHQSESALTDSSTLEPRYALDAGFVSFDADGNLINQEESSFNETVLFCFLQGTRIATPAGEVAVEDLRIGDPVCTADGRVVPVRWMGRQQVHATAASRQAFAPVRIRAGALGPGVPHSDLYVSAGHGMIVGDLAITAAALVNGDSIAFVPTDALPDSLTYWHIETEAHEEILANGAPAETFVDAETRRGFDNYAEYLDLYGDEVPVAESARLRITAQRLIPPEVWQRLSGTAPAEAAMRASQAEIARIIAMAEARGRAA